MRWLNKFRWLFGRKRFQAEMEEELSFHLERAAEELEASGVSPAEARRQAKLRFGSRDSVEERTQSVAAFSFESFWADLRFATRMLRKNRALTLVVILSMAIGIGANVSMFTAMNAVMLRMLPVREPEKLVVFTSAAKKGFPEKYIHDYEGSTYHSDDGTMTIAYSVSTPTFENIATENTVLDKTFAFASNSPQVNVGLGPNAVPATIQAVSGNFFDGLGVTPMLGRIMNAQDDGATSIPVAVVSERFWASQLNRDSSIIGRTVTINESRVQIVGVVQSEFFGLDPTVAPDFWIPLSLYRVQWMRQVGDGEPLDSKFTWWLTVVGRLKPQVTRQQAAAELDVLFSRSIGATVGQRDLTVPSLRLQDAGRGLGQLRRKVSKSLWLLMGMVAIVLLIACANVAALLLARSTARRREVATRLSLGAPRRRVIRQLMTESVLLSVFGGALGFALSYWMTGLIVKLLDIEVAVHIDPHVLWFAIIVSVACGILFGWAPAMHATRVTIPSELRQQTSTSTLSGRHRFRLGRVLVAAQVSLCVLLLVAAGLLVRTLRALQSADLGFKKDKVLTFLVRPGSNGYKDAAVLDYYRQLQARLAVLPGVRLASYAQFGPIDEGASSSLVYIPGYTTEEKRAEYCRTIVGPNYFETLSIPVVHGRAVGPQDTATSKHVVAINEAFVKTYLRGNDPLGMQLTLGDRHHPNPAEVVGVIHDVKYGFVREDVPPTIYFPFEQMPYVPGQASYLLLADAQPSALFSAVNNAALTLNPNVPIVRFRSEASVVQQNLLMEQTFASLSTAFAVVGLLLACIGLYGTVAYSVAQRTGEIGIRIALGAAREAITRMILGETLRIITAGIIIGVPAALVASRLLRSQLYQLSPHDSATIIGAVVILAAVSIAAALIPARKAARIDPLTALRHE
jgi:predicted permease